MAPCMHFVLRFRALREGAQKSDVRVLAAVAEAPLQFEAVLVLVRIPGLLVDLREVLPELLLNGPVGPFCGIIIGARDVDLLSFPLPAR